MLNQKCIDATSVIKKNGSAMAGNSCQYMVAKELVRQCPKLFSAMNLINLTLDASEDKVSSSAANASAPLPRAAPGMLLRAAGSSIPFPLVEELLLRFLCTGFADIGFFVLATEYRTRTTSHVTKQL
jgi:hypothetical protein